MKRTVLPILFLSLVAGCARPTTGPDAPRPVSVGQAVIYSGFNDAPRAYLDSRGLRVGPYFDFSPYDSLHLTFAAARTDTGRAAVVVALKVGPGWYYNGLMTLPEQSFAVSVPVTELSKARFSALTFMVRDSTALLLLSDLRVIGWYTYTQ